MSPNSYLDAGPHPRVMGRYVNHHFDPSRCNTRFQKDDGVVSLVTLRDIAVEEELYTDYGSPYWKAFVRKGAT